MSLHVATIHWTSDGTPFTDLRYSRAHQWHFDGGSVVPASASPHAVRLPFSDPAGVDPEEAFVASLSSCHMLWFLGLAAEAGFRVLSYHDEAAGYLERNVQGRMGMTRVVLRPAIDFDPSHPPTPEEIAALHHRAHQECYIANSVTTEVTIEAPV